MYLLFSGLVPPAVRFRGSKSIAAYRRALKNGKTMVVRARVILIGATGAGKSSLLNALHQKFSMDASLDKDELMAWRETVCEFGAQKYLVPSRELSESPTRPWAPFLVEEPFLRTFLSRKFISLVDLLEWRPPSGPYMDWPTHRLKGNANTLYDLKVISWIPKTHLSLFLCFGLKLLNTFLVLFSNMLCSL